MKLRWIWLVFLTLYVVSNMNAVSIEHLIKQGELKKAITRADKILLRYKPQQAKYKQIDSLRQIAKRTYLDFSIPESEILEKLQNKDVNATQNELTDWERKGWLEYKILDGRKFYFNRAIGNLKLRLKQQHDQGNPAQYKPERFDGFKINDAQRTIANAELESSQPEHRFRIKYKVTVQPNAIPNGETVRCWLPWPKENHPTQFELKMLNSNLLHAVVAPNSQIHRTIYVEKQAVADIPTIFEMEFEIATRARWFDPDKLEPKAYNRNSRIFRTYTAQQAPHIVFSKKIRSLTDKIVGDATHPFVIVEKIYDFVCSHTIWSGAQEYGIMDQIPHYVIDYGKGDCGMQTLLFMSMARYKGIPVRWQSGFMLHPGEVNLHDWCEVYYEGIGWVPLDMSFQWLKTDIKKIRSFYMTGLDAYRLIINDGIGGQLYPSKTYFRSEPFDFQRGELEWRGGNLYFNAWTYSIEVHEISQNETDKFEKE